MSMCSNIFVVFFFVFMKIITAKARSRLCAARSFLFNSTLVFMTVICLARPRIATKAIFKTYHLKVHVYFFCSAIVLKGDMKWLDCWRSDVLINLKSTTMYMYVRTHICCYQPQRRHKVIRLTFGEILRIALSQSSWCFTSYLLFPVVIVFRITRSNANWLTGEWQLINNRCYSRPLVTFLKGVEWS